jgi:hypothetical protein
LIAIKKTRDWLIQKAKWVQSKWPYAIIRQQKAEIARLRGKTLSLEESLILQSLWAFGVKFRLELKDVIKNLGCKSQKALHVLNKLYTSDMLFSDRDGYGLAQRGSDYIVNNNLEISKDEFIELLKIRKKSQAQEDE